MTNKSIKECIKEYFKTCPYLDLLSGLNMTKSWDINPIERPIILGSNVLGNITHRSFEFMITTGIFNPSTELENLENLHLFESITEWVYQNSKKGIMPSLNNDEEVISMSVETGGYIFNDDKSEGTYRVTCKMLYDKREE